MGFIEEFFGRYDERSEFVERAAGDMAFKLLWVLLLIVLVVGPVMQRAGMGAREVMDVMLIMTIASLMVSLFVKYLYCWIHNIARARIMVKFGAALVFSVLFMIGLTVLVE